MNRFLPPVILVVAAALAACSSSASHPAPAPTTTAPTTTASTTAPASASPTTAPATTTTTPTGLAAKALATSDLPFGWATSPSSTNSSVTSPCPAITSDATKQMPQQAETDYQQSEDGPFLQDILATGSVQQAHALWASFQKAGSACKDSTTLTETKFPSYGDETYTLALTATRAGVKYTGNVVVVRKGQVFVEVVAFGVDGVSASMMQTMVENAVTKATS